MKITELDFLDISEYLNSNVKALVSLSKAGNMKDDFIRDAVSYTHLTLPTN